MLPNDNYLTLSITHFNQQLQSNYTCALSYFHCWLESFLGKFFILTVCHTLRQGNVTDNHKNHHFLVSKENDWAMDIAQRHSAPACLPCACMKHEVVSLISCTKEERERESETERWVAFLRNSTSKAMVF